MDINANMTAVTTQVAAENQAAAASVTAATTLQRDVSRSKEDLERLRADAKKTLADARRELAEYERAKYVALKQKVVQVIGNGVAAVRDKVLPWIHAGGLTYLVLHALKLV